MVGLSLCLQYIIDQTKWYKYRLSHSSQRTSSITHMVRAIPSHGNSQNKNKQYEEEK